MQRRTLILLSLIGALLAPLSHGQALEPQRLSADEARRDLRLLKRAFTDLHPGLYRYVTPAEMDAEFAAAESQVNAGASRAEMLLLASRLAAAVRCGHTWGNRYNQAPSVVKEVYEASDKLPLTLRWVDGRFLVTGSSVAGVKAGAELLAVDGRSSAEIAQALLPYLRADGRSEASDGKRLAQLSHGPTGGAMDRLFPLRFAPGASGYLLRLQDPGARSTRELQVAAVSIAARSAALQPSLAGRDAVAAWQFRVDGDTAFLSLPTFAFWNSSFDARGFLRRSFDELRAKAVPFLIIDIRQNEGGDDAIGQAVLAQLLKRPHSVPAYRLESAYERAPYALARYLDTWDFGFFDRTGKVSRAEGERNWRMADKPAISIDPVAEPYAGQTLVLVGPENSSAGYLLARDLQRSGAATLLGQPTGGNLRGLNGGQLAWINLPASGVGVDIPLVAAFAPGNEPDGGVQPDLLVMPRFTDAQAGIDTELRAAQQQIARWRASKKLPQQGQAK